jgi:polysaccharide deacetylase 2 family uncharacterized protein YibQ
MIRPKVRLPPSMQRAAAVRAKPKFRLPKIGHRVAAFGACALVALLAIGSIQLFGDPSAAGPRRILSLAPSEAAASAPRVSLSDAAEEALSLEPDAGQELPYSGEMGEIDANGELRVAVVEAPSQATPGRPNVAPLPRAPLAGLSEPGPNGPLPIVAANGRTPAQAYARPFTAQPNKPLIAVVVGGLGFNATTTASAIDELPPEITLSFAPYSDNLQSWIDRARAAGHEVLLELPMEPFDPDADDTGPQTLLATATAQQNVSRLEQLLSHGAGYFGVTNYQGARFATSAQASAPIAQALRRRGLVFISSGIGQRTALSAEAQRANLPVTAADRLIDVRQEADAIDDQLLNLEALALQNHSAIGAGFAYPVTIAQVGRWAGDIASRGYQLAPASAVLNARAGRR